jgi:hypothetical protein
MKNKIIVFIVSMAIALVFLIARPRSNTEMMQVAKSQLMEEPLALFNEDYQFLYKNVEGPLEVDKGDQMLYTWYSVLDWGDTATISALVYKSLFKEYLGIFRAKNPPDAFADIKWYYVVVPNGISKFDDILNHNQKKLNTTLMDFRLSEKQASITGAIKFLIKPERLLFILKKGHFQVVDKHDGFTIVEFYQVIANLSDTAENSAVETRTAKIYITDSTKVIILPCIVSMNLSNKTTNSEK